MLRLLAAGWVLLVLATGPAQVDAQVFLPGTQPGQLVNWPLDYTDPENPQNGQLPGDCQTCHGGYVAGLDYEPFDTWSGSMMANSARDPLFWAAVDIANQDVPGVGEFCIRCHSPTGWLGGRSSAPDGSALLGYPDELDSDFEGIGCAHCHRMYEGPTGTPYTQNGQYWVDDGTPTQQPPRRGPYGDAFAPHAFAASPFHADSDFCGVCHDLYNPLVQLRDQAGQTTGIQFPEQLTYTEWTQSALATEGTSCQDCHMPAVAGFACSSFTPFRNNVYRHDFVGANTFIPQVLRGLYGTALNRTAAYTYTIERATAALQTQSATVEVTVPAVGVRGDSIDVDVRVTNLTGHKLPTGYPEGRRMWLRVVATDGLGVPFFESGAYDVPTATLAQDPQIHVYETVHGIHGQGASNHLVLNDRILKDNRIPPRGFIPDARSMPVAADFQQLGGGVLAHWDDVRYRVPVPAGVQGPIGVTATLRYQTASREYVEFLRDENVSGPDPKDRNYPSAPSRGQKMHDLWTTYGKSAPVDMTSDGGSVPVVTAPTNVSALHAQPGHGRVMLAWANPAPAPAGVRVLRKLYADYPEFGDPPSSVPAPAYTTRLSDALAAGWTVVYDGVGSTFIDTDFPSGRSVAYYAAYTYDGVGVSAFGTLGARDRSTCYLLGDLGQVGTPGAYDGIVNGVHDLPVFSLAYGTVEGQPGYNAECDIGPTDDGSSTGTPLTDNSIDFSDLVVFALAFGTSDPGGPLAAPSPLAVALDVDAGGPVRVTLGPLERGAQGELRARIEVRDAAGRVKALHLGLQASDGPVPTPGLEPGEALQGLSAPVFRRTYARGAEVALDIAVLGRAATLERDGLVAVLSLPASFHEADVAASIVARAHDAAGAALPVEVHVSAGGTSPELLRTVVALSPAVPNPFNPRTTLELSVPAAGWVDVAVFDLSGRRVRTLLGEPCQPGTRTLVWDGADSAGRSVASGVYIARATMGGQTAVRRMALVR